MKRVDCHCTKIQQDETCPVGYPSLICGDCNGTGLVPAIKLDGSELWEIVFGIADDVASEITDDQYEKIADAINAVFIDIPPPSSQMMGWVYDPDHPMSDGGDTRMTAAEEVLAYLLVEVVGSPDDVPYSPNDAQRILEDRLKEGRRLEADYADFLAKRRAAQPAPAEQKTIPYVGWKTVPVVADRATIERRFDTRDWEASDYSSAAEQYEKWIDATPAPAEHVVVNKYVPDFRKLAVEIVDGIRGYTFEFSSHPAAHKDDYDFIEEKLRAALAIATEGSGDA